MSTSEHIDAKGRIYRWLSALWGTAAVLIWLGAVQLVAPTIPYDPIFPALMAILFRLMAVEANQR